MLGGSSARNLVGRRRLGMVFATSLLAVLTAASPAYAIAWSGPVALSSGQVSSGFFASLGSSGGSYVHVVYRVLDPDGRIVRYRRSADGGVSWSPPIELSRPAAVESSRPSLSVVSAAVDVVWAEGDLLDGPSAVWYRRSINSGATWTAPARISPTWQTIVGTPTVVRQGNTVVVTYTTEDTGRINFRISVDGGVTWQNARILGVTSNRPFSGDTAYEGWPSMAFGNGVLYAVWASSEKNVVLKRSFNGGASWTTATALATAAFGGAPRITASGNEAMLVFGHFTGLVNSYAAFRKTVDKGSHWGPRLRVSGGSRPAAPQDVRHTGGRYRFAYGQCLDDACNTVALFYRESVSGATWTSPVRYTQATNAGVTAMGIGHTSLTGRTWLGWAGFAAGAEDGDIFVRSVQ